MRFLLYHISSTDLKDCGKIETIWKIRYFLIKVMKTARQTGNLLEADDAFNSKSLGHEEILDVSYLQLTLIFIFPFYLFMYVTLFFISQHVFCNQPFYYLYRSCRISPGGLLCITPSICIFLFRFGTILVFFFTFYSFEIFSCILNCS